MAQTTLYVLSAADLESNRAGRLTPDQRKGYGRLERGVRKSRITFALILAVLAALILTSNGPTSNSLERPAAGAALAAGAVLLLLYGLFITDALTRDLRSGAVQSVEGAIGKHSSSTHGGGSSSTSHFLEVAGRNWEVASRTYEAAPDAGWVRLYYMPRSHDVVNLELLPDRPLAEGAATTPFAAAQTIGGLTAAFRSHDKVQVNEARAESTAVMHSMRDQMAQAAVPPPAEERDSRPLEKAIVGTWQMGPVSMTFMPDGSMVATLPGGGRQSGSWSIGPDGKLHATATGREQVADAWVAGDTLTLSENGQGLPFHRVAVQ
jgi:hypothetical protein